MPSIIDIHHKNKKLYIQGTIFQINWLSKVDDDLYAAGVTCEDGGTLALFRLDPNEGLKLVEESYNNCQLINMLMQLAS